MDRKKTITIAISGQLYTDQRIIRIASSLSENNYKVTVFYRSYLKYKNGKQDTGRVYPFNNRKLTFLFNTGVAFYFFFNLRLFLLLLFRRQHILCAVDADTLPAFTLLSKLKRTPLIYDAHEYFAEVPELENKPLKQSIWHKVTQMGVKQSTDRYTVSETLAKALEERYGSPFKTIRNLPFYKEKDVHLKHERPTIIYQGALNKGRELELLIGTMQKLPGFDCIIIGEGDLSEALRNMAKGAENVKFLGLLSPEKINIITQKAFLGYNLLDAKSKSYYYSLSNKYFDYMQAGVPSISSELPEYELLNSSYQCGLCIPNTEEDLLRVIHYCHEHKDYYLNLQQNALLASLNNNWENESQKLISIYDCL